MISFAMLAVITAVMTLLILETTYLAGDSFKPANGSSIIAPGLTQVAISMFCGMAIIAYLLFWTLRRLILDPIDEIIHASTLLARGEPANLSLAIRADEIGQLALAFNHMAENVMESRARLEEKVRVASEKVEHTMRDLAFAERLAATGRLAAGVAHEINNPLGGVMNAVARLRKIGNTDPEKTGKYLDICDDGLKRIQTTVRRILDFSRKRPEVGPVPVTAPLLQSLELVRHLLDPNHITLDMNLDKGAADQFLVLADAGDLQHVFLNLLMNAIDAMPAGGTLSIVSFRMLNWVLVEISDTGIGMTPDELSASFDYFHTTKSVGKGTGLGLSIAHHIVAGYHGALTLNSMKGVGTKATVEMPSYDPTLVPSQPRRGTTRVRATPSETWIGKEIS